MNWYQRRLIKKAKKDLIPVEWWNKNTIITLKQKGIFKTFGIAPKGPKAGKECVCLTADGEKIAEKMAQEIKEQRRFWAGLFLGGLITLFVTVLAPFVSQWLKHIIGQ